MEDHVDMTGREQPRFYEIPTGQEIGEVAKARERARARKIDTRISSGVLALGMGTTNLVVLDIFTSQALDFKAVLGAFGTPILANTIGQIKTERAQRRDLADLVEVVTGIVQQRDSRITDLETENSSLRNALETAGLPLPENTKNQTS